MSRSQRRQLFGALLIGFSVPILLGVAVAGADIPNPFADDSGPLIGAVKATPAAPGATLKTTLTAEEKQRAIELTESSSTVRDVIGAVPKVIGNPGLWSTETNETIGATVPITLAAPITISVGEVPAFEPTERGPTYVTAPSVFSAENVTDLEVYVDFNSNTIVAVEPGLGARLTWPPGYGGGSTGE